MTKADAFEDDILNLFLAAKSVATLAGPATAGALTQLHAALHTGDPGDAGNQATSEATYGGYARTAISRTTTGWDVTGGSASPVSAITFPEATGGSNTVTHFSIGTASSGAGKLLYSGTVTPNISVSQGVTPRLTTSTAITED